MYILHNRLWINSVQMIVGIGAFLVLVSLPVSHRFAGSASVSWAVVHVMAT